MKANRSTTNLSSKNIEIFILYVCAWIDPEISQFFVSDFVLKLIQKLL